MVQRPADGPGLLRNRSRNLGARGQCLFARQLHLRLPFPSSFDRRGNGRDLQVPSLLFRLLLREPLEPPAYAFRVDEPFLGGIFRCVYPDVFHGPLAGLEDLLTAEHRSDKYDVLVIGAGGAGLRAAIEASAQGASVGLVCKSLLGKAHTVMAEGGIAGALAYEIRREA